MHQKVKQQHPANMRGVMGCNPHLCKVSCIYIYISLFVLKVQQENEVTEHTRLRKLYTNKG